MSDLPARAQLAGIRWVFETCLTCEGLGTRKAHGKRMRCLTCHGTGYIKTSNHHHYT